MSIREALVRAINRKNGVDVIALDRMQAIACVSTESIARYLNVSVLTLYDWKFRFKPMPKAQYIKAMNHLYDVTTHDARCKYEQP